METTGNPAPQEAHTLTMEGRERARLTGVTAVSCFNDQEVVLETTAGEIALMGDALHIEQLNLERGALDVTGTIAAIEYSAPVTKRERRGLFARRKRG